MSSLNLTKRAFRAMTTAIPAITAALMMLQSGAAEAKPTVETLAGLNTGDTYNLIYITSTKRDATSSTLTDYDAFVDSAAASGSRTDHIATWKVLGSTAAKSAYTNLAGDAAISGNQGASLGVNTDGNYKGVFNTAGDKVAENILDLFFGAPDGGSTDLLNAILYNENGTADDDYPLLVGDQQDVWTGSDSAGGGYPGFALGMTMAREGYGDVPFVSYISGGNPSSTQLNRLYGVSAIQVAVPEPSTYAMLGGMLCYAMIRRGRKTVAQES